MDYESLKADQRRTYLETVSGTHWRRVELVILTKNGGVVRSLTNRFLGGGIHGDDTRTPVEVLEAQILDDDFVLDWHHGQHRKYLARVIDSRFIPEFDDWVDATVFTGPLWDFERTGPVVSLVAQGLERLAMGSVRQVFHRPRKSKATPVVRDLLQATGAPNNSIRVPHMKARLPESVTVGVEYGKKIDGKDKDKKPDHRRRKKVFKTTREDTYWGKASTIARALDRDLFADNRRRFVMAAPSKRPIARLDDRHLLSPVMEKRGTDGEVTNTWVILGANPKGPKEQVRAVVALPKKHPLSPQSLAWHGTPYQVTEVVENRHLRRKAQAIRLGKRLRDSATRELVEYQVEALPVIPWIRPGSLVSVPTGGGGRASMRVHQWTLPLGPDASPMTLGANRRSGWR